MTTTIDTKYVGTIDIKKNEIINFSVGLPGFSEEKEFILLDLPGNPTFQILQSIATTGLAFIVTNPYHFYVDYTFKLDDQMLESLQIKQPKDVIVLTIVTVKTPFDTSTLNLKAPIIIHSTRREAKQYILNHSAYMTKAPIVSPNTVQVKGD